jgi:carboxylesterase
MTEYLTGAEPLYIEGNTTGCLLLHGAGGGTAWDLKEFAYLLHEKTSMTIWLPSIAGFGTKPEDLFNVTLDDWLNDAETGIVRLLETCEQAFIVGHSAGGLLALLTASMRKDVDGLVTWAAPYDVQTRILYILPTLSKIPLLRRAIPKTHASTAPEWLKKKGWVGYDWIPTNIGLVMYDGLKRLKKALNRVNCPALIIQGTADDSVTKDSAKSIFQEITSESKEILLIEGAHHPMMNQDKYKEELFTRTIEFLQRVQQS